MNNRTNNNRERRSSLHSCSTNEYKRANPMKMTKTPHTQTFYIHSQYFTLLVVHHSYLNFQVMYFCNKNYIMHILKMIESTLKLRASWRIYNIQRLASGAWTLRYKTLSRSSLREISLSFIYSSCMSDTQ
jgi:hypothetical protein